jgi:hypothetical protein
MNAVNGLPSLTRLPKQQLAIAAHFLLCRQNDSYAYTEVTACKAKPAHAKRGFSSSKATEQSVVATLASQFFLLKTSGSL